jgi:membrane-associated protease RseP (regulator of RpoE activity)
MESLDGTFPQYPINPPIPDEWEEIFFISAPNIEPLDGTFPVYPIVPTPSPIPPPIDLYEMSEDVPLLGIRGMAISIISQQVYPWHGDSHHVGSGVRITYVMPGTPAENAGLVEGDMILYIDDVAVEYMTDLHALLYERQEVVMAVMRAGEHPFFDDAERQNMHDIMTGRGLRLPRTDIPVVLTHP